jgi:DNA topoisomerase-1
MKLVVIEGPGKKDTIKKYLGSGYDVVATKGHVRDLPEKTFGVNLQTFQPEYAIMPDKKDVIKQLKEMAQKAEQVLIATDPDREGEAIGWHIANILNLDPTQNCRVVINEISKDSVQKAIEQPRQINLNLVNAQQARRILDRIVGYKLSPIICKKIQPKLSAGRVQSVALKLVVDREEEINSFVPQEYWNISALLTKKEQKTTFKAALHTFNGKKEKPASKEQTEQIVKSLENATYKVIAIKKSKTKSKAPAPFTTSTMQQDALNKLGMNLKKTSACAQNLYEGVTLGNEGKVALITYIRTDSTRVSEQAQQAARKFIEQTYGKQYVPNKPNVFGKKQLTQDAHEAIRPISLEYKPEDVKQYLSADNYKLYKLIYDRFVASQMADAEYSNVTVDIEANNCIFRCVGKTLEFAGYTAVYSNFVDEKEDEENVKVPVLTEGEILTLSSLKTEQKFTKPPLRYTEASLVKAMEEKGIGRPATYAPTITLLASRNYTEKEGKYLKPTSLGTQVTKYLDEFFEKVINVKFTADMENKLDEIAENQTDWQQVVSKFWNFFKNLLEKASKSANFKPEPVQTDIKCNLCGSIMLVRQGKFGPFLGCSNFPSCRNIMNMPDQQKQEGTCPLCGKTTVVRKTKKGTTYYSCSGYPDCKFMSWDKPTGTLCPECNHHLVEKKNEIRCSHCEYKQPKV